MPWKNGKGTTTQICIHPASATLEKNDFMYRLSSASIEQDSEFSLFPKKERILLPIKGAGFRINSDVYEKFEIARFSAEQKTRCTLLKGPVLDFGIVFDPAMVSVQVRVLHLKTNMSFSLESEREYLFTVLEGELTHEGKQIKELETLHYKQESSCQLSVLKSVVLLYTTITSVLEKQSKT